MSIEQIPVQEIEESQKWLNTVKYESTYTRDLQKRIKLINWVLENMKNPDIQICALIETKMNEIIDMINKKDSIDESDPLDTELRILDWILYQVCVDQK
jgi:hypothetical protein